MKKSPICLFLILVFITLSLASCDNITEQLGEDLGYDQLQTSKSPSPTVDDSSGHTQLQNNSHHEESIPSSLPFASLEAAYYNKYAELAKKYGTYSLYDYYSVKGAYSSRSYLNGVCIVNLMDFNGDGVQDLFAIYSNKHMDEIILDGYDFEVYDFPTKYTYELEIWTYENEELVQILHESPLSKCDIFPNIKSNFYQDYRIFITVFEKDNGSPVIQIFDENGGNRDYINIYYADEKIVRDKLTYNGDDLMMNGKEITESVWSENIAGYNKILLCSLLADSNTTSSSLLDGYNIDYNNTLLQTERVVRYLSQEDRTPILERFYIADEAYISLYLQEIERTNRERPAPEFTENHYFNLYDMDQDGVAELILYEGSSGAGTHYHFYTMINKKIIDCGFYGRTSLFVNREGGLIAYFARMNGYDIKEFKLIDGAIEITDITDGYTQESYPELEALGYDNYEHLIFCPPAIPMALYVYNQNLK